jgi:hypothetical protein
MNRHPYLRAYMAGIVVPTIVILFASVAFTLWRYVYNVPIPIERVIVFPMAIVPNLWGVWNMLHLATGRRIPIGLFGAILPFLLVPGGYAIARLTHFDIPSLVYHVFPYTFVVGAAIYYLLWKHVVGSLNAIVGVP